MSKLMNLFVKHSLGEDELNLLGFNLMKVPPINWFDYRIAFQCYHLGQIGQKPS